MACIELAHGLNKNKLANEPSRAERNRTSAQQGELTCAAVHPAKPSSAGAQCEICQSLSSPRVSREPPPRKDRRKTRNRYTPSFLLPCSRCCGEFSCPAPAAVGSLRHRTPSALPPSSRKRKVSSFSALLAFPPPFPVLAKVSRTRLLTDEERLPSVRMTPVCRGLSGPPVCVVSSGG